MQMEDATYIEEFQYPSSGKPAPSIWKDLPTVDCDTPQRKQRIAATLKDAPPDDHQRTSVQTAAQNAENAQRSFEAGRAQGIEEGRQLDREEHTRHLREFEQRKIREAAELAGQVADERDRFLRTLEAEVVKLSLSIASRILKHEAQVDPLFLSGAVRVALGQLAHTATVRLRVPAADLDLWSETIAHLPNLKVKPTVVGDETMRVGDCVLETDMGDADLGIGSQLQQIADALSGEAPSTKTHGAMKTGPENLVLR